jgi:hypothetical protein
MHRPLRLAAPSHSGSKVQFWYCFCFFRSSVQPLCIRSQVGSHSSLPIPPPPSPHLALVVSRVPHTQAAPWETRRPGPSRPAPCLTPFSPCDGGTRRPRWVNPSPFHRGGGVNMHMARWSSRTSVLGVSLFCGLALPPSHTTHMTQPTHAIHSRLPMHVTTTPTPGPHFPFPFHPAGEGPVRRAHARVLSRPASGAGVPANNVLSPQGCSGHRACVSTCAYVQLK